MRWSLWVLEAFWSQPIIQKHRHMLEKNISSFETHILCNDAVCISFSYDRTCWVNVATDIKHILQRNACFLVNCKFGISCLDVNSKTASVADQGSADLQRLHEGCRLAFWGLRGQDSKGKTFAEGVENFTENSGNCKRSGSNPTGSGGNSSNSRRKRTLTGAGEPPPSQWRTLPI